MVLGFAEHYQYWIVKLGFLFYRKLRLGVDLPKVTKLGPGSAETGIQSQALQPSLRQAAQTPGLLPGPVGTEEDGAVRGSDAGLGDCSARPAWSQHSLTHYPGLQPLPGPVPYPNSGFLSPA